MTNRKEKSADIEKTRTGESKERAAVYAWQEKVKSREITTEMWRKAGLRSSRATRQPFWCTSCCWPGHLPFDKKIAGNRLHFTHWFVWSRKSSFRSAMPEDSLSQYHGVRAWKWPKLNKNAPWLAVNTQCRCRCLHRTAAQENVFAIYPVWMTPKVSTMIYIYDF